MRGVWIVAATLVVGAGTAAPVRAGVYFTTGTHAREFARSDAPDAQELWPLPGPFQQFHQDLAGYRAAALEGPNHERYKRRVRELEAKESQGTLSLDDRINLGAYYIRLGKYPQAVRILEPKAREEHFLLLANLATAHELSGAPDLAVRYRERALAAWPAIHAGWDTAQLNFYRKAEVYHLRLLQLRQDEAREQPARGGQIQLDKLFPRVRFVGPSGQYEAGGIAPAQWGEIPSDASSLVMQLLLWLPFDDRLHWLLGELLNASGDVTGAAEMMKPVVEKPVDPAKPWGSGAPPELRAHYRAVSEAAAAREKLRQELLQLNDPFLNLKLLCAVAPRGLGLGAGDLMQEASWVAVATETVAKANVSPPKPAPPPPPAPVAPAAGTESWVPNWRQLGVGFGAGALVALLLSMQFRQMGRTRG
jgi:hypothetical protein